MDWIGRLYLLTPRHAAQSTYAVIAAAIPHCLADSSETDCTYRVSQKNEPITKGHNFGNNGARRKWLLPPRRKKSEFLSHMSFFVIFVMNLNINLQTQKKSFPCFFQHLCCDGAARINDTRHFRARRSSVSSTGVLKTSDLDVSPVSVTPDPNHNDDVFNHRADSS